MSARSPRPSQPPGVDRPPSPWLVSAVLLAAVAFYRPLTLWADNFGRVHEPLRLLAVGLAAWVLALAVVAVFHKVLDPRVSALALAVVVACLFAWEHSNDLLPGLWLVGGITTGLIAYRLRRSAMLNGLMWVAAAAFGLSPLVQLSAGLFAGGADEDDLVVYRLPDAGRNPAVEDVVLVVFDGFPSPQTSRNLFDHHPDYSDLAEDGFVVSDQTWSTVSATSGAIPSLVSLGSLDLMGIGPDDPRLQRLAGGDNPLAGALQSAGFRYTHFQSGWYGSMCRDTVDDCRSPTRWSLTLWELLTRSVVGDQLRETHGSAFAHSGLEVVQDLTDSAGELIGDGEPDYVFAHVLLPHAPFVLGEDCRVVPSRAGDIASFDYLPGEDVDAWRSAVRDQLTCGDRLVRELAGIAAPTTAMVITADHGTEASGQMLRDLSTWSNGEIAERLAVFGAYRFPDGCDAVEETINALVVRRLAECALDVEVDLPPPGFQLFANPFRGGTQYPTQQVPADRMESIRSARFTASWDSGLLRYEAE